MPFVSSDIVNQVGSRPRQMGETMQPRKASERLSPRSPEKAYGNGKMKRKDGKRNRERHRHSVYVAGISNLRDRCVI